MADNYADIRPDVRRIVHSVLREGLQPNAVQRVNLHPKVLALEGQCRQLSNALAAVQAQQALPPPPPQPPVQVRDAHQQEAGRY